MSETTLLEQIKRNKEILAIKDDASSIEIENAKNIVCPFYKKGKYPACATCIQDDKTVIACKEDYLERIEITPFEVWSPSFGAVKPIFRERTVTQKFGMLCDKCYFADVCSEYAENHTCSVDFGDVSETDPKKIADTLIQLQQARIKRAEAAELVDGGIPDNNLSGEMDRLTGLLSLKQNLYADKFSLKIEGQATGNGGGILAQLFGGASKPKEQTAIEEGVAEEVIEIPVLSAEKIEKIKNPQFEEEEKPKSRRRKID